MKNKHKNSPSAMRKTEPKWKKFEKLVARIQEYLSPGAEVTHNDKILGKSGRMREIDVSIKKTIGQFHILIVIECKDHAKPLGVNPTESFIGKVMDVGAHKGAIVSASGFTNPAISRGEKAGLNLYRLIDVGDHEWRTFVTLPAVCDFRGIKNYSLTFKGQIISKTVPIDNPPEIMLYDKNNKKIDKIKNLINNLWDQNKLPTEPGEYREIRLHNEPTRIRIDNDYIEVTVLLNISIQKRLFFGQLPIEEIKGLKDEITGRVITRGFTTEKLDMAIVEKEWRQIASIEELAIQPVMMMQFTDCYTQED